MWDFITHILAYPTGIFVACVSVATVHRFQRHSRRKRISFKRFCKVIPKIELHAHLHGSIRDSTLIDLMKNLNYSKKKISEFPLHGERSISECFEVFALIHKLVLDAETVARITREVLEDFAADNVKYVELRSTPRVVEQHGLTKRLYVKTVVDTLKHCEEMLGIRARLILSINRKETLKDAFETLELAMEFANTNDGSTNYVVGLDFSGNPTISSFSAFYPVWKKAKESGLKLAIHMTPEEKSAVDTTDILQFNPDRLGHAVCLNHDHKTYLLSQLQDKNRKAIPIEICPTSNVRTINTDDMGVFSTSLSEELFRIGNALKISKVELGKLVVNSISHSFLSEKEKQKMSNEFRLKISSCLRLCNVE
eukprot:GSMAST32.ASY1.ANO1.1682.1 assembled CDS